MRKFDRYSIWEIQALNPETFPNRKWVKISAKKQRELFGYVPFGKKSVLLDVDTNIVRVSVVTAFGQDSNVSQLRPELVALRLNEGVKF